MAEGLVHETGSELLAGVCTAVATLRTAELGLASGLEQLALLREGLRLEGQLHTWLVQLAAQVDTAQVWCGPSMAPRRLLGWLMR